jgi:hypothetical protein
MGKQRGAIKNILGNTLGTWATHTHTGNGAEESRLYISQQHKLELLWAKTDKNMKLQSRLKKRDLHQKSIIIKRQFTNGELHMDTNSSC